ncbi:hypothetical protein AB4259_22595 [Vibrio amylolyticus]|uniref:hypothetical protein n=1 Tax=Vibrio amylolyticus TaxID=2847292 RepID=UPI0035511C23
MEHLPVGVRVYRSRWCLVFSTLAAIFYLTPTSNNLEVFIVVSLSLFCFYEIYAWIKGRTILVISYDGIYHYKHGFISWSLIESLKYRSALKRSHGVFTSGIEVTLTEKKVSYCYWLPNHQKLKQTQSIYLRLVGVDCNLKSVVEYSDKLLKRHRRYREQSS